MDEHSSIYNSQMMKNYGESLWLSGKVKRECKEKINEIKRSRVCSPARATFKKS
jgi:hypothetical protein